MAHWLKIAAVCHARGSNDDGQPCNLLASVLRFLSDCKLLEGSLQHLTYHLV